MRRALALIPALCLTLAACGGDGGPSETSVSAGAPSATPGGTVNCEDPNLDQATWVESCSDQAPAEGAPAPATIAKGKPLSAGDGSGSWTITKTDCQRTTIASGSWTTEPGTGDTINADATAQPGFVYCIVEGTFKNDGTAPVKQLPILGSLETADGKMFSPDEEGGNVVQALFGEDMLTPLAVTNLQPTQSVRWVEVYQVTAGSQPAAIVEDMSQIRLALK